MQVYLTHLEVSCIRLRGAGGGEQSTKVLSTLSISPNTDCTSGNVASVPMDEEPSPIKLGPLSLETIVQAENVLTEQVKQPNRAQNGSGDFVSINVPRQKQILR